MVGAAARGTEPERGLSTGTALWAGGGVIHVTAGGQRRSRDRRCLEVLGEAVAGEWVVSGWTQEDLLRG